MTDRFDLVFGLGSACSCSQTLRAAGLQLASFPLDWVSGGDLACRTKLVLDGFADWMTADAWERQENPGAFKHDTYLNRVTGFVHPYDFDQGKTVAESYPSVKAKYDRRIARLLGLLANAKRVLLVWVGDPRDAQPLTAADVERCLAAFRSRYLGAEFQMLALDCRPGVPPEKAEVTDGDGFRLVAFDYRCRTADAPAWTVEPDLLQPLFAGLSVRDYRTDAERRAYAAAQRRRELERFGASNAVQLLVTKLQYRLYRHLCRHLARKNVKLDDR